MSGGHTSARRLPKAGRAALRPRSKCVPIGGKGEHPLVCNDGATVGKQMEGADPEEDLVSMLRQAAERAAEAVGDGPTTSMLFARAMCAEGVSTTALLAVADVLPRWQRRGDVNAPPQPLG